MIYHKIKNKTIKSDKYVTPLYFKAGYKIIAKGMRNKLFTPDQKTM
jgi:hypothetical protein